MYAMACADSTTYCCRRTPNSFELLQTAAALRKQGSLPQSLGLWAVENPLLNSASRLERKVSSSATDLGLPGEPCEEAVQLLYVEDIADCSSLPKKC